jgi:hypothetical protein
VCIADTQNVSDRADIIDSRGPKLSCNSQSTALQTAGMRRAHQTAPLEISHAIEHQQCGFLFNDSRVWPPAMYP